MMDKFITKNKLVLAPLLGVSNRPFRKLCRQYGAGLVYIPMIHVERIIHDSKEIHKFLSIIQKDNPIAVQIIGNDPINFKLAMDVLNSHNFIIDLNFGCPSIKMRTSKRGGYLLKHPDKVREIVQTVVKYSKNPVSAKIRTGWDENSVNALEIARILEEEGVQLLAIHGKTVLARYRQGVNLKIIKKIKERANIPIIGNGEIFSPVDVSAMISETNCDYVMIGRASIGNPFFFKQCREWLDSKIELERTRSVIIKQIEEFRELCEKEPRTIEKLNFPVFKNFCLHAVKHLKNARKWRILITQTKNENELLQVLKALKGEK